MADLRVTVAVLTYKRPDEVEDGLPQILEQVRGINQMGRGFDVVVVVVDNDPAGSCRDTVTTIGSPLVTYVVEPSPGISAARNRAMDESRASRLIAFIDDDERPQADWLKHLLEVWAESSPAAVSGRVVPQFEAEPEPWIVAGRFFRRRSLPTGTELELAAAGNLLLDLDVVRKLGIRFAGRYGLAGGEDTLFTRQMYALGARMVWCDESVVVDMVPADRMTRTWVLRRAFSHGNTTGLITIDLAPTTTRRWIARAAVGAGGTVRMPAGLGRWMFGTATRSLVHQARGLRLFHRGRGMVSAATGKIFQEYDRKDSGSAVRSSRT